LGLKPLWKWFGKELGCFKVEKVWPQIEPKFGKKGLVKIIRNGKKKFKIFPKPGNNPRN